MPLPPIPPPPPGIHQPVPQQVQTPLSSNSTSITAQVIRAIPHIGSLARSGAWEMRTWSTGKRCKTPAQLHKRAKRQRRPKR